MADESDQHLIRAYARNRCESSFSELVHRHIDLVCSTALRVLRDPKLAEDVTDEIRQPYGSVDALLVDWAMNLAEAPEGYRVLSQREDGPDAATLTVQFQYPNSRVRENDVSFYRDPDGVWRRAIPACIVEKLPQVVNSWAQVPTAGK